MKSYQKCFLRASRTVLFVQPRALTMAELVQRPIIKRAHPGAAPQWLRVLSSPAFVRAVALQSSDHPEFSLAACFTL
eukprot:3493712-Amphidinium_carterae.2